VNNLQQVTTSFDALASKQRECIFQHLDLFVAGVQTVATGIKVLGIPIVSTAPRLISFTFDGQITPDVVTKAGGVALIKGVSVWTDRSLPPSVQLKAANYSIIGTLIPQPGDSINDFRVPIGADLISSRGGQCLYVDVTSYVQKSFVGIHFGKKQSGEETLPMCIPQQFNQSISMLANVAYSITTTGERTLSSKRFDNNFNQSLRNTSCEDRHNVSVSAGWDSEIPASWRIVRVQQSAPDIVNQSNIGVSFTSDSVTAAGWLDTATCFKTPFSASLIHDTHWYMTLTPVIDGPNTTNTQSSGSTLPVAMNFPTTSNICASVPKDPNSSGASSFWVTLTPYIHGEQQAAPLYVGPRETDPTMDAFTYADTDTSGAYQISVTYNPTVVSGTSQVCATLTVKGTCAW